MSAGKVILPPGYAPKLDILKTEIAIKLAKDVFERELAAALNLTRVSAPLFVRPETGLNDNLNGVERPVAFDIPDAGCTVEVVHSLAKWKRMALKRYGFPVETGLYTDMDAIRRDEILDNLHSVYVDQWDWEKIITAEDRTPEQIKATARAVYECLVRTKAKLRERFPELDRPLPEKLSYFTTQEMEDRYPELSPKERENAFAKEYGAIFILQIGGKLKSGIPHDGRAPDYDDWELNGDLLVWNDVLGQAFEVSSMGIRVDAASLDRQLTLAGCDDRRELPFHKMLLSGQLPLTMGGGIGQSRICMLLLEKAHIGEVQSSVWPEDQWQLCQENGIALL